MKTAILLLVVMLTACAMIEGSDSAGQEQTIEEQSELPVIGNCTQGGGACRKGCRVGEELSDELECGHDQACCVPVQDVETPAFCESVGGTCRKSRCRANEELTFDFECGTDAACCVPR